MKKLNLFSNKECLKYSELALELQRHFLIRLACVIGGVVLLIIFMLSSKMFKEGLWMIALLALYAGNVFHDYYNVISRKMYVYEGICEQKRNDLLEVPVPSIRRNKKISAYGKSTIVVSIKDEKYIVPAPHNSGIYESNTIRFYALPQNIYPKNDNCFIVTNPLLVIVSKI